MKTSIINRAATSERIRKLMEKNGLTVRRLHNDAFCFGSVQAVHKWCNGGSLPKIDNLSILAVALGTPMSEIVVADTSAYTVKTKGQLPCAHVDGFGSMRSLCALPVPERGERVIPSINAEMTGMRIEELMSVAEITARDVQEIFGFNTPQAIYKWCKGVAVPTVEHLAILAAVIGVSMDEMVVVDIVTMSLSDGTLLSVEKGNSMTMAAAIKILRDGKTGTEARE